MQYELPKLFRTRYDKDAVLEVSPGIIYYSSGFYIQKGSMKGVITSKNNTVVEIDFPEKTLILDEGYKLYPNDELIRWDSDYQSLMVLNGWKLVSQEEGTISICLLQGLEKDEEIINIVKNDHVYRKINKENAVYAYSVRVIQTELNLNLPENHLVCVAKGKVTINGKERNQRFWARSTGEQELNIVNMANDESIIFLSKIK